MKIQTTKLLREYIRHSLRQNRLNEDEAPAPYTNQPNMTSAEYSNYTALDREAYAANRAQLGDRMTQAFMKSGTRIQPSFYSGGSDPGPLLQAFVQPFTDIFKTAVAGVKAITTDVATFLKVGFEAVITSVIPFISADYQAIFDRRDERMEDLKNEYADVFERTDAALGGEDAQLLGFMLNPAAFLAGKAALKSPAATKELLSVATGGLSDSALNSAKESWDSVQRAILNDKQGKKRKELKQKQDAIFLELVGALSNSKERTRESYQFRKTKNLFEKIDKDADESFGSFLKAALKNEKVVQALSQKIKNNSRMKDVTSQLSDIDKETLKSAEESAKKITQELSTIEGIKKLAAKDPKIKKALDSLKEEGDTEMLVDSAKKAASQVFVSTITTRMNMLPKNSDEYKEYQKTLEKISKL